MRVRLRGWFRLITLVPWHEAQARLDHHGPTLEVEQLRPLIAEVPGLANSLRALLFELGETSPLDFVADAELAERVVNQIRRGYLRVEAEPDVPMSSDEAPLFVTPAAYEPEPLAVDEDDHHWVEVELVDEAGAPVAGERCRIVLPDGTERHARTDHNGLVRIDRAVAGSCTITFPELDDRAIAPLTGLARAGAQIPPSASFANRAHHWIEVELVDDSGAGVAGELCEITLPTGKQLRRRTDADGVVRMSRLAAAGNCDIRFPELDADAVAPLSLAGRQGTQTETGGKKHWIEVELVDETGAGVAGEPCEIKLPTGELLRRRTDKRGLIRVPRIAAAGDCTITFPELDADALVPPTLADRQGTPTEVPSASNPPTVDTHWIEVELVDDNSVGVAGQLCAITLPDGEQLRRRTDANGLIRVPKIAQSGDCTISFVDLDATVWAADTT